MSFELSFKDWEHIVENSLPRFFVSYEVMPMFISSHGYLLLANLLMYVSLRDLHRDGLRNCMFYHINANH